MSTNPAEADAETSPGAAIDDASGKGGESNEEAEETKLKEEDEDGNRIVEQQQNQTGHILWIALVAIFLRLFCAQLFTDFFQQLPLFSTPWSSLKRLREGIFLAESGTDPYQGDLFHVMPLFLHALRPSLDNPTLLRVEWMILDFLCAYFLREFVLEYIRSRSAELDDPEAQFSRAKWLGQLAFAGYLLNPMTIGCWVVANLSAILNTLVAASLLFTIKRNLPLAAFTLALAIQLNPYYVVLFAPIFVQFADQKVRTFLCSVLFTALLFASNFVAEKNPQELLRSTIGFFLTVPDLTPNSGIFWYFFTQVFEHYRLLFLCVFQFNTLIYVVPLSALLRKKPALLASVLLITVALFSPYPSYAETALYLPTLAAFFDLHKYLRQRLITGCTILATFVLSPVMWAMWVTIGSGNANFFFAIVWVSNLAQIFISADLISSFLRSELVTEAGGEKEMEERFEGVRLFSVSPL